METLKDKIIDILLDGDNDNVSMWADVMADEIISLTAKKDTVAQSPPLKDGLSVTQPTEPGYYWWLPECYLQHKDDDNYWTIIRCHPNDGESRVGLFEGPLKRETDNK
jgi:hypothetical protein